MLDFIGDVRNDLDRSTQVVTTALFTQHVFIHTTSGEVIPLCHACSNEPFVMTQIQIRFSAIIGDKDFTVLKRTHGAWINIDIRVQFQHGDLEAPGL